MTPKTIIPEHLRTLSIVRYPNPVLRRKCAPVETFDQRVAALAQRMLELMHDADGVGLAAPQVGVPIRMFVYNLGEDDGGDAVCVNPKLSDAEGAVEMEEGCLSLPSVSVPMRRAVAVTLRGRDEHGTPIERRGRDLLARVWQHEADHLDGRLIIDNMSEVARIENRRAIKQLRDDYRPRATRARAR